MNKKIIIHTLCKKKKKDLLVLHGFWFGLSQGRNKLREYGPLVLGPLIKDYPGQCTLLHCKNNMLAMKNILTIGTNNISLLEY